MKTITLIHPFKVEVGQEAKFLTAWKTVDDYMQKQPGFIETKLHKSLGQNKLTSFSFVNVALWESAESFNKAINSANFMILAKNVLQYSSGPGLYELINE